MEDKETARERLLDQLRRDRGICSVAICNQPIAGWCLTCTAAGRYAPKLCAAHLDRHCLQVKHIAFLPYEKAESGRYGRIDTTRQ